MVWHHHRKIRTQQEQSFHPWKEKCSTSFHYTSQCQIYDRNSKPLADWLIPRRGLCGVRTVSLACHRDGAWDSAQLVSWHIFYKNIQKCPQMARQIYPHHGSCSSRTSNSCPSRGKMESHSSHIGVASTSSWCDIEFVIGRYKSNDCLRAHEFGTIS